MKIIANKITDNVYTSVWIAALIKTYINLEINKTSIYWLSQSEIRVIANQLCTKDVQPARVSQWCNADHPQSTYNYLRANNNALRRLTRKNEFHGVNEIPNELPINTIIFENNSLLLSDLISWYKNNYCNLDVDNGYQHEVAERRASIINSRIRKKPNVVTPCSSEVKRYLDKWNDLENYTMQEEALDKLFSRTYPKNTDINDVLIKVCSLNDFYSTNIFSVFPVAKHIVNLDIDNRLTAGDLSLVNEIAYISINDIAKNFYSFATKYCSHHNPIDYPIYDSFVKKIIVYFRNIDNFMRFDDKDLKDFSSFKEILFQLRKYYDLEQFTLKEIDKYLWLLGKETFPKKYKKNKKQ